MSPRDVYEFLYRYGLPLHFKAGEMIPCRYIPGWCTTGHEHDNYFEEYRQYVSITHGYPPPGGSEGSC